jgi:uncharacterized protein (DUF362 family)
MPSFALHFWPGELTSGGGNKLENIYVRYGTDGRLMTRHLMEIMGVAERISPDNSVVIKPNLVNATPASQGATTHPEIVRGIIEYLKERGIHRIEIAEGSWLGADTREAFRICGYESISKDYDVGLFDLKKDRTTEIVVEDMRISVCNKALQADFLINVPVLKTHCQTSLTGALKNLKGCIPDREKRRFHTLGIHRPVALLNKILRSHLVIVDGLCGDLYFEEGGTPLPMHRIITGSNPLNIDLFCADLIGYFPEDIEYLRLARAFGIGDGQFTCIETNSCSESENYADVAGAHKGTLMRLSGPVVEDNACSACLGTLLHALSKTAASLHGKKFSIGQGFKGKKGGGIGIGNCTAEFSHCVKGCPPTAGEIIKFIRGALTRSPGL